MKKMRNKLLLPILAVVIAVGSAFASQIETEDTLWAPGYISVNTPCDTEVHCGISGTRGCTAPNGMTAFELKATCGLPAFKLN
ncbi:hypothetical protein LS48_01130 [Aequorivita aquimaris]|uniref:Secreted protein n=2 Tax=Aequorivita aquimaris TaxID=1548749 RepID=A0A137RLN7_9FLAO|nr:hypothetical protein LS48_01130 [Aequorivita aquimaris]